MQLKTLINSALRELTPILRRLCEGGDWDESKHKRASDGKFGSGGGKAKGKGNAKVPTKAKAAPKKTAGKKPAGGGEFSEKKDKLGRRICYQGGKRCPCSKLPNADKPTANASAVAKGIASGEYKDAKSLTTALMAMSVADINEVKKSLGLKASGNKAVLAAKVAEKALAAKSKEKPKKEPKPKPTPAPTVDAYYYEGGTLFIRFKDGALCQYDNIPFDLWFEFLQATSKGRFVHDHLINRPYTVVS